MRLESSQNPDILSEQLQFGKSGRSDCTIIKSSSTWQTWKAVAQQGTNIPPVFSAIIERNPFAPDYARLSVPWFLVALSSNRANLERKGFRFMPSSRLQRELTEKIEKIFPNLHVIANYSESWLLTEFNRKLQLDIYIPALSLAVEVQGPQHLEYLPHFHKTPDGFQEQLERDRKKREICSANNVLLLEIFDSMQVRDIIEVIAARQDLSSTLEYTPQQWTHWRKQYQAKRARPAKMAIHKIDRQIRDFQSVNPGWRLMPEHSDMMAARKILIKNKQTVEYQAILDFASIYSSFYKIQASDASYNERVERNGVATINRASEYRRTLKNRFKGDDPLKIAAREHIQRARQASIEAKRAAKKAKVEEKAKQEEQAVDEALENFRFIVQLAKKTGHSFHEIPPTGTSKRIRLSAEKMLKPMGITWESLPELRAQAQGSAHYLSDSPDSVPYEKSEEIWLTDQEAVSQVLSLGDGGDLGEITVEEIAHLARRTIQGFSSPKGEKSYTGIRVRQLAVLLRTVVAAKAIDVNLLPDNRREIHP